MRRPWWGSSRTSYTTPVSTFQVVDEQIIEHGGLLPIVKFSPKEDDFWVVRVSSDGEVAPMRGCLHCHLLHLLPLPLLLLNSLNHAFYVILTFGCQLLLKFVLQFFLCLFCCFFSALPFLPLVLLLFTHDTTASNSPLSQSLTVV